MVLNRKQGERNMKISDKKQRKLSKKNNQPIQATNEDTITKEFGNDIQQTQNKSDNVKNIGDTADTMANQSSVSMESMVTLISHKQQVQFLAAIKLLKHEKYKEAVESLKVIIAAVQEQPNYGVYAIYTRTRNKRTTLSALNMFAALAYEGLANPKKAIEFCNYAISEDPGWPIPFSKRSEYFSCLEQFFLDTNGAGKEEIIRSRKTSDIKVDPHWREKDEQGNGMIFTDLQEALNAASEGDRIFLEPGHYYREEGFNIHCRCSILGASTKDCILASRGSPTVQICGGKGGGEIVLQRLQFHNKYKEENTKESKEETMTSSAAHVYIISPDNVTVRDCLFVGGEERTGGILVAEEAFYQSLLELEFENPELMGDGSGISHNCLNLLVDFCIFSDCQKNCNLFTNNQSSIVISNSWMYNCGHTGIRADEGSTLNIINSQISNCASSCIHSDNVSSVNIRGCLISQSGEKTIQIPEYPAGLTLVGKSKGNISKSLLKNHLSAVTVDESDLVFEENCVMDISKEEDDNTICAGQGLQLQHRALYMRGNGNIVVQRNNFHNCNLVWLVQHGASPRIVENNIETCLIGFICGARSMPRIESNKFQCIFMSIGMFIEESSGCLSGNVFNYVANGLDVYRGSAPLLARNTYSNLSVPGLQSRLEFDIVKVSSGGVEDMEGGDIITFNADVEEKVEACALLRRKATSEKLRNCSNCGMKKVCVLSCDKCDQIFYCSEVCRGHDRRRHRAFCSLTLKDLL